MELDTAILYYSMRSYLEAKAIEKEQAKKSQKSQENQKSQTCGYRECASRFIGAINCSTQSGYSELQVYASNEGCALREVRF